MRSLIKEDKRARIFFIRHAESENNVVLTNDKERYEEIRVPDPLLSKKGEQQAVVCAKYLRKKGINPKVVYSSCFTRALETAKCIYEEFNCKAEIMRDIFEIGGLNHKGLGLKGSGRKFFEENYPMFKLDDTIQEDGWNFLEKKETLQQGYERAKKVVLKILELSHTCADDNKQGIVPDLLFISHGNFLDQLVGYLLFRQIDAVSYIQHNNTGITCFEVTVKDHFVLNYLNDYNHLYEEHIETNEMTQSTTLSALGNLSLKQHNSQPNLTKVQSQNLI